MSVWCVPVSSMQHAAATASAVAAAGAAGAAAVVEVIPESG